LTETRGLTLNSPDKIKPNTNFTVLYVEDQKDIQEEFQDILSLLIDKLVIASNGKEGLEKYQEALPDIIITDIQMPLMNGLNMIKEIRRNDKDIPIIVTSAFNESTYLLQAIELGIEHYLLKPVMLDQLQQRLQSITTRLMQKRELELYQLYLEDRVVEEMAIREEKESLLIQQNKAAEVGQMVSVIAHQWKQPLHYLYLLIEDLGIEFDYQTLSKEYIQDFIKKGTDRINFLSKTMDNFLSFYKNSTEIKSFSVNQVTQEIFMFLQDPYKTQGISLNIHVNNDFSLTGIENELQQVILNLINNAKEAFKGQKRADANITVTIDIENGLGMIKVEDNAGGIDETILNNIFDLEFTTKKEGNGIGLYLVKKIVNQRFKGKIDISNSEVGAYFILKFTLDTGNSNGS